MKKLLLLFALLPIFSHAGVIMKKSGERLVDVTILQINDSDVSYKTIDGTKLTLSLQDVFAILFDDGRYQEIHYSVQQQEQDEIDQISDVVEQIENSKDNTNLTSDKGKKTSRNALKIINDCQKEGNDVYNKTFEAEREKALKDGYSKSESHRIASSAAHEARVQAINECIERYE